MPDVLQVRELSLSPFSPFVSSRARQAQSRFWVWPSPPRTRSAMASAMGDLCKICGAGGNHTGSAPWQCKKRGWSVSDGASRASFCVLAVPHAGSAFTKASASRRHTRGAECAASRSSRPSCATGQDLRPCVKKHAGSALWQSRTRSRCVGFSWAKP